MSRGIRIGAVGLALVVMFALGWGVAKTGVGQAVPIASLTELERDFTERMENVVLVGHFTIEGRDTGGGSPERYEITRAVKVGDDRWRFDVHMVYGSVDVTLPVVVPIAWAGDGCCSSPSSPTRCSRGPRPLLRTPGPSSCCNFSREPSRWPR